MTCSPLFSLVHGVFSPRRIAARTGRKTFFAGILCLSLLPFLAGSARGANQTWIGGTGTWNTTTNWTPNTWVSGNTAIFNAAAGTVTVGTQTAGGLTFNVGGYTLTAGTLTLNTGTVLTTTSGTTTFDSTLNLAGAGGVALTKTGAGVLSLATNNSSLGTVGSPAAWTVTGGSFSTGLFNSVLSVTVGNNLGASPTAATTQLTLDAGTLQIRGSGANNANTIGSTRTIQVNAAGGAIADVSGFNNQYNGNIVDNAGSSSSLYLSNAGGTTLITGTISGAGTVTWNGAGLLNLTGSSAGINTFTGGIVLNSGTLGISAGPNLGGTVTSGTQVTFAGNSALQFQASIPTGSALGSTRGIQINNGVTATFDTQGFTVFTNNGISAQSGQTGVLNKIGSGTLALGNNNGNDKDDAFLTVVMTAGTLSLNKGVSTAHAIGGGGLTINGGLVQLTGSTGDQVYDAAPVTVNSGTFDMLGKSETIGSLNAASAGGIVTNSGSTASVLTVGAAGLSTGAGTFAGTITDNTAGGGTLALIKSGSSTGTLTLSGSSNYTGTTTVNAGTLALARAGTAGNSIGGTLGATAVTVNSGGTLLLSASNALGTSAAVTLAGGTFNANSFSEGNNIAGAPTTGMGTLTLSGNSTLDFGSSSTAGTLAFSDSHSISWTGTLTIMDWNGIPGTPDAPSGKDALFFGTTSGGLSSTQLGEIQFSIGGKLYGAQIASNGEVFAAVPEPTTVFGALALLGFAGYRERRQFKTLARRLSKIG